MVNAGSSGLKLGVNGFGRIGKLTVWHHVARKYFDEIVVNIGRQAGVSLADIAHYVERDSTYGWLHGYLYGHLGQPVVGDLDEGSGSMVIDGVKVVFLRHHRDPAEIGWENHDVRLVVDTTGQFLDPVAGLNHPQGTARGHLASGAAKVILSAPFKLKNEGTPMPEDAVTTIMGINDSDYDPRRHTIISNASCTTTCLAHMMKPLIDAFGSKKIMSASMATIHAATGSQEVLDRLPKAGKADLRKNRSIMNNIILTTTGAAKALRLVIPEMEEIAFIAESVRVPTSSGSLIILVTNLQEEPSGTYVSREMINDIYRQAAADNTQSYLYYTGKQNVSGDIIGLPKVAATIEGHETHTRTAEAAIDLAHIPGLNTDVLSNPGETVIRIPVTQAVIYGWYDNEMGSYVNMLGDRTVSIAELM
ncbi:MAG: glyceraldehyde 3-phosphate dehydrogenase NAD-binding domain-containing protein [Desulfobacteraceae bacterium]|jgi:glyceraldehyde 3-phosphate dehydrogenase|nr:glyceraldehyde 3-phosphate dehydrogenase NAD-binding domain-containing protein [Desulfobacteraceae bacterium]